MQNKENVKRTLVVNLFAQPGAGKSTGAAYLFYNLKCLGVNCEYVSEFAKDKVWEENKSVFEDQNYIFAVSHPTSDQEGVLNYDLNIYAIQNDMITTSYYNAKFTVSDAFEFKGLELATNSYSTLKNKMVIGLQTRYAHQGGINPYKEFLTLFELHKAHKFHRILDELPIYEAENIQSCIDQDSEIKRLFILDNKSAYGLQNIKLKETKTRIKFQPDSCEMIPTDTSRSHILKYDGQQYHFDREKFFSLNDPNQEE